MFSSHTPIRNRSMAPADTGASTGTMKRELSVEDLFGPLNRLDVRHPSGAAEVKPLPTSKVAEPLASGSIHRSLDHDRSFSAGAAFSLDMASIPEEIGFITHLEKPHLSGVSLTMNCNSEDCVSGLGSAPSSGKDHMRSCKGSSSSSKSNISSSTDSTALQAQGNSTSDEDQQLLDNRKQRRMLSNRESARRSRLRKQQHLDELRGHVAQLQAQNSQMLSSFNLASHQFAQITEENRKLRSEAMDLSHQLQRLHHTVTTQRANNGLVHGTGPRHILQGPQY